MLAAEEASAESDNMLVFGYCHQSGSCGMQQQPLVHQNMLTLVSDPCAGSFWARRALVLSAVCYAAFLYLFWRLGRNLNLPGPALSIGQVRSCHAADALPTAPSAYHYVARVTAIGSCLGLTQIQHSCMCCAKERMQYRHHKTMRLLTVHLSPTVCQLLCYLQPCVGHQPPGCFGHVVHLHSEWICCS